MEFAKYAYFEGKVVPFAEARISVATHGFLYGTAVFEGIRGFWDETKNDVYVFRLREHYERLAVNAHILKMSLPRPVDELVSLTIDLIRKNELRCDLYIRPVLYKSDRRFGVTLFENQDLTIFFASMGAYLSKTEGIDLAVSSWRRIEDNAIPGRAKINGAYVNSCLAGEEARSNGFDEAIFLNEDGHVSEAPGMNLFVGSRRSLDHAPGHGEYLGGHHPCQPHDASGEEFGHRSRGETHRPFRALRSG